MHRERMGANHEESGSDADQYRDKIEKIRIHPRLYRKRSTFAY